ncbi:MAG: hypothetical protein CMG82_07990 [Marinobacter sp.]|nr:hypothetical protein [Marinobacter sp.]
MLPVQFICSVVQSLMPAVLADNASNCTQVIWHSQAKTGQQWPKLCCRANFCQIALLPDRMQFQSMTALPAKAILAISFEETTIYTKETHHE